MKGKIWGIIAIVASIVILACFAWTWLVSVGPDSDIWECRLDGVVKVYLDESGSIISRATSGPVDWDVPGSLRFQIFVFFVPMTIVSLTSNILLIKMRTVKIWGIVALICSFGIMLLYMVTALSLPVEACKKAEFANKITTHCFFWFSIISIVSSIVLIRRRKAHNKPVQ